MQFFETIFSLFDHPVLCALVGFCIGSLLGEIKQRITWCGIHSSTCFLSLRKLNAKPLCDLNTGRFYALWEIRFHWSRIFLTVWEIYSTYNICKRLDRFHITAKGGDIICLFAILRLSAHWLQLMQSRSNAWCVNHHAPIAALCSKTQGSYILTQRKEGNSMLSQFWLICALIAVNAIAISYMFHKK